MVLTLVTYYCGNSSPLSLILISQPVHIGSFKRWSELLHHAVQNGHRQLKGEKLDMYLSKKWKMKATKHG